MKYDTFLNTNDINYYLFYRLDFDRRNMYRQAHMYQCAKVIMLYGFVARVYIIDNEPCEVGVTCDEAGFPIDESHYGGYNDRIYNTKDFFDKQGTKYFSTTGAACRL